jgi:hypothetical protein
MLRKLILAAVYLVAAAVIGTFAGGLVFTALARLPFASGLDGIGAVFFSLGAGLLCAVLVGGVLMYRLFRQRRAMLGVRAREGVADIVHP